VGGSTERACVTSRGILPERHRSPHRGEHKHCEYQPGHEKITKYLAVKLQMHEVRDDDLELDDHKYEQRRDFYNSKIKEVGRYFDACEDGKNGGDLDIANVAQTMIRMFLVCLVFGDCGGVHMTNAPKE